MIDKLITAPTETPLAVLLQDANRVAATDLYPVRCRTVIANLTAAICDLMASAQALGALPDGYCFCSRDRHGTGPEESHEPECRDMRAAMGAANGA